MGAELQQLDLITQMVKDRLAECAVDIFEIKRAWSSPPSKAVVREDCVCAYGFTGETLEPVSASRGVLTIHRNFVQRFLVLPFAGGSNDMEDGAEIARKTDPVIDRVHMYYHSRPRLETTIHGPLRYCDGLTRTEDSGSIVVPAPGGKTFAAVDFVLSIVLRINIPRTGKPY
jgi:hypothetical protein